MKSRHPKAVHLLLGKPLAHYPVELCRRLGISRILVVVPPGAAVQQALGGEYDYVEQPEGTGSAEALRVGRGSLGQIDGPVLVLAAHQPLVTLESLRELLGRYPKSGGAALLAPDGVLPATAGALPCVISTEALDAALTRSQSPEVTGAREVTEVLRALPELGYELEIVPSNDPELEFQVADRCNLAQVASILRHQVLQEHLMAGVTIEDPDSTYIETGVSIGQDTVIRPMSFLGSGTVIGEDCEIGPFVRVSNCRVGNKVSIQSAVLADSDVGDDTKIGPFSQLRPGCRVGRKVKIGNFVELKNATVEDGASLGHLAYVGDAFVGTKSNIGAGTITCNYDGKAKHHTHIGRNSFVGSHTTLVAPVAVGDGAFIAAGSVVTEEVPDDALAIGRGRQVNKPGWAKQRRERE